MGKSAKLPVAVVQPIRRFLRAALLAEGYAVAEATNCHVALTQATALRPDLVILDLGLPDGDGLEVIRSLREWTKLPILVLSVRGHEQDKIAALDAGADTQAVVANGLGSRV